MDNESDTSEEIKFRDDNSAIRLMAILFECLYRTSTPTVIAERIMYQTASKFTIPCTFTFQTDTWTALMKKELRICTKREAPIVFDMDKQQELDKIMYEWRHNPSRRDVESVCKDIEDIAESNPTTNV